MGFLDKIKEFRRQISAVESNIYSEKQDFLEIYERNVELEHEIESRTKELDVANQRMLSLQHIWDMMNSSKPLSSVLQAIVNSLEGELGYLHSCIVQKKDEENTEFLSIIAHSSGDFFSGIDQVLGSSFYNAKLSASQNDVFGKVLMNKEILQTTDLRACLSSVLPEITEEEVEKVLSNAQTRSLIIVPLSTMKADFGWLIVFSSREEAAEGEINFLNMFAKQIEMAVTIADLFQAVKEQAVTDGLTGLYNRRYFEEFIEKEVIRANRQNQPFTIIGLDLDHLKEINDKYGHSYGDLAITTVANVLKANARSIDVPSRIGGEEFDIILPGIDSKGGLIAAERIRKAIESQQLETIGHVTASIGVATFLEHSNNVDELIELTDQAMYISKRNGRNQVTLAKPIGEVSWQEVAVNAFLDILSKHRIPIDEDVSKDLCKKLEESEEEAGLPKETLFNVTDMLSKLYNPLHSSGSTKAKVQLATSLAKRFELSKMEVDKLRIAMLLYDIGNMMLPNDILQKSAPLTDEEREHIKEHPVIAARDILKPISNIQDVIPIIEKHHENWDGTGYPNKISGSEIPLTSQIVLIVDAFYALLEARPYRPQMVQSEALEVIKKDSAKKWNPRLVDEFVSLVQHG